MSDLADLVSIAGLYSPLLPSEAERVEALVEAAMSKKYGSKKMGRVARLSFGADPATAGCEVNERHRAAWEAFGEVTFSTFTTHVTREMHKDLASQVVAVYESGEIAEISVIGDQAEADRDDTSGPDTQVSVVAQPVITSERTSTPTSPGDFTWRRYAEWAMPVLLTILVGLLAFWAASALFK